MLETLLTVTDSGSSCVAIFLVDSLVLLALLHMGQPPLSVILEYFCLYEDVAFSEYFFVPFPLSLCKESTSYVISSRMVFFYLVTTGWIFDISLCENSINQSKTMFSLFQVVDAYFVSFL